MEKFTGVYPVPKTLKFGLIPQGRTLEHIEEKGIIQDDEKRAEEYKKAKKIIDRYHKAYIQESLEKAIIDWNELADAIEQFRRDKSDASRKKLEKAQEKKRKQIKALFKKNKNIFKKELFTEILPNFITDREDLEVIEGFNKFTTYFKGFHENRNNMYSDEEKSTSIANRVVNENFSKFYANINVFKSINKEVIRNAEQELKAYLKGITFVEIFEVNYYNNLLTQTGIDFFNEIIGGISQEQGATNIKGFNQFLNEYFQKNKDTAKLKMTTLFKQILSDTSTNSFIFDEFENDKDIAQALEEYSTILCENQVGKRIKQLEGSIDSFNKGYIFVDSKSLSYISNKMTGRWDFLELSLRALNEDTMKKTELDKWMKQSEYSIQDIENAFLFGKDKYLEKPSEAKKYSSIVQETILEYEKGVNALKKLSKKLGEEENRIKENQLQIEELRATLESIQEMMHILKPFNVDKNIERDSGYYSEFDDLYNILSMITPIYNKIRNYVTKKPYSVEKFKLNFENPTLADGWDKNKEQANTSIILLKDGKYYLGIMNAKDKPKLIDGLCKQPEDHYDKMILRLISNPTRDLPNLLFIDGETVRKTGRVEEKDNGEKENPILEQLKDKYLPKDINRIRKSKTYLRSSDAFNKSDLGKYISYYQDRIVEYKKGDFDFSLKDPKEYNDYMDFIQDLKEQSYSICFEKISANSINKWIDEGKLYLFQIYNKDFAEGATGRENLHTLYWKAIFDEDNLRDVVVKLNGQAELFFRRKSISKPIKHKDGEKLVNRIDTKGQPIPEDAYQEIFKYANGKLKVLSEEAREHYDTAIIKDVKHEITKDKRYTEDKFFFHVPITINYKAANSGEWMNKNVCEHLKDNPDVNIIGIDRGERHLLYVTLINQKGEILKQKSYNTITIETHDNKKVSVDYHEKLEQKEKGRDEARKTWSEIGNIKNLKEGYLSQVIHQITEMMIENNAIIVLEDLNFGFKRGRFKVEKQVYQKFEKMLIDKLNYLTFKDRKPTEVGGVLKGYQLAEKFKSFKDMGKQSGFLCYIPAAYTSKIDPTTGFANIFDLRRLTNVTKKQEFFSKFESIRYDKEKDAFVFKFNYDNFDVFQTSYKKDWEVYTNGKRILYNAKDKMYFEKYLTEDLKRIFDEQGIDYQSGKDIKADVISVEATKANAHYYDCLYNSFKATLQMRNSRAETGEDYIVSPVMNKDGKFYVSDGNIEGKLPADADANGAYHIALKGLYMLMNISDDFKLPKVTHEEWFRFVQEKAYGK